jgi:hypothetical protein
MKPAIAQSLAREIEEYADRLRRSHPLFELADRGGFPPAAVATYLANVRFTVNCTTRHLECAERRSRELAQEQLTPIFHKKLEEEQGHERWADEDLALLKALFDAAPVVAISPSLIDLMHELDRIIQVQPSCYLSYALFAEYLTVLLGPAWVATLERECGIPSEALSVITKHIALDRHHVEEEIHELDLLLAFENVVPHLDTIHRAMRAFEAYFHDLYALARMLPSAAAVAAE